MNDLCSNRLSIWRILDEIDIAHNRFIVNCLILNFYRDTKLYRFLVSVAFLYVTCHINNNSVPEILRLLTHLSFLKYNVKYRSHKHEYLILIFKLTIHLVLDN